MIISKRTFRSFVAAAFLWGIFFGVWLGVALYRWRFPPFIVVNEASWDAFREFSLDGFDIGADSVRQNCELRQRQMWKARIEACGKP